MMKLMLGCLFLLMSSAVPASAQKQFEKDVIQTASGDLEITFIGHGSFMMQHAGTVIQIDPYSKLADYATFPKPDVVLITHQHYDHFDQAALKALKIRKETTVILNQKATENFKGGLVMNNGDTKTIKGITIEAVPAYNIAHKRDNGQPFHPKGEGNGYILTIAGTRIYIAGDTENIPEMKALKNIDYAFLPMNLPYTMTPEMVADAAKAFRPKVVYPYHYGDTDTARLVKLLKDSPSIEVRIRRMP
ncbi:MAG: MBL fold metallo-hydrolase [Nitrospirota bacterium]